MALRTMYGAINNSPVTTLNAAIIASDTTIQVNDVSCLPDAPNVMTLGIDENAELVLYTGKSGSGLTGCTRGFNGTTARSWPVGTKIYRGYSAYDHDAFKANIEDLDNRKIESSDIPAPGTAAPKMNGIASAGSAETWSKSDHVHPTDTSRASAESVTQLEQKMDKKIADLQEALTRGVKIYGAKWDKTNQQMTRLFDASDITTNLSGFVYKGSKITLSNPFDDIYPFSDFKRCNVDLTAYNALESGADIKDAIVAWYGDPDYAEDGSNGFVGRYRPEYWYTAYEDDDGNVIYGIASGEIPGWIHSEECIDGIGYAVDDPDASGTKVTSIATAQPLTNVAVSAIHARAKASGFTIEDIYSVSAITTAFVVEMAMMNAQTALGDGCSAAYRANENDRPHIAETGATRVVLPSACAAFALDGATLDFAASKDGVDVSKRRICRGYEEYSESGYISVKFDQALDITTDMYVSFHGRICDEDIGNASGYIGTNGKHNAYYRGAVLFGNRWRYILGAYRKGSGDNEIWLCPVDKDPDNYDALNTTDHVNTGKKLPRNASDEKAEGYVGDLHIFEGLGAVPIAKIVGGNASNPVGDYCYQPALTTGDTILLLGGSAPNGASCGPFSGSWSYAASNSHWYSAARPLLKKP